MCLTTPLQMFGSAGFIVLVLGATLQESFPRQSFATMRAAAPGVPWQVLEAAKLPQEPDGAPMAAKSTLTKCWPAGQLSVVAQPIVSTLDRQTVVALAVVCFGQVPGGAGGAGGAGGGAGGASGAPNMIVW